MASFFESGRFIMVRFKFTAPTNFQVSISEVRTKKVVVLLADRIHR